MSLEWFVTEIEVTPAGAWLLVGLAFVLGGVLGSFMNVVVYRLPRHMSLSFPGSRCPACEHPIRARDNVPILGWLMLRGRCRDCRATITPRYPLVEAFVAVLFAALTCNKGFREILLPTGEFSVDFAFDFPWLAYHLLLPCALTCAALIEYDGFVPTRLLGPLLVIYGVALIVAAPTLQPVGELISQDGIAGAVGGVVTGAVLAACGWLAWFSAVQSPRAAYASACAAELAMVGFVLGDRAVIQIAIASMALYVLSQWIAHGWPAAGRFGWSGPLLATTLGYVFLGADAGPLGLAWGGRYVVRLIVACSLMIVAAAALRVVPPPARRLAGP